MEKDRLIFYMHKAEACYKADYKFCAGRTCTGCPYDYPVPIIELVVEALKLLEEGRKNHEQKAIYC